MKNARSIAIGAVVMAMLCGSASSARAVESDAPPAAPDSCRSASDQSTDPASFLDRYITARRLSGDDTADIQDELLDNFCLVRIDVPQTDAQSADSLRSGSAATSLRAADIDPVDPDNPSAPDDGSTPADINPDATTASSTNGSVSVTPPSISYDSQARLYYGISYWKWVSNSWIGDAGFPNNADRPIGGVDGFGTSFSQILTMKGFSATAYGDTPTYGTVQLNPPSSSNSNGAGYEFQDRGMCRIDSTSYPNCQDKLNVRHGQEVISFLGYGGCKTVQGFASYGHSWSSTRVTGISLSQTGAGFSWSTTSSHWTSASQPGGAARVC